MRMAKRSQKPRVPISDTDPVVGAMLYAIRVGVWCSSDFDQFLIPRGVTLLQFNVLRILFVRDPERAGLPTGTVGRFLLTRVPDVPRLIDRMVKAELIERSAAPHDRRVVLVRLTQKGVDLVESVMDPVYEHCRERSAHMTMAELTQLHELLRKLYAGLPRDEA